LLGQVDKPQRRLTIRRPAFDHAVAYPSLING
jgi:hypothetical protein